MTEGPIQNLESSREGAVNDNKIDAPDRSLLSDLVMGLRFYSRYPVPGILHEPPNLNRMAPATGFVGVALGLPPAIVMLILAFLGLPPLVATGIAVAVYVVTTGAMAEDALADSADGLFGGSSIVTRLAILQDSRHGTYGVCALVLFLITRVGALASLVAVSPLAAACVWVGATTLSRSGAIWLTLYLPPARLEGNGATAGRVGLMPFAAGFGIAGLLTLLFAGPFVGILGLVLALIICAFVAFGWAHICKYLLGGQTGDLIGALQALLEITVLAVFVTMVIA